MSRIDRISLALGASLAGCASVNSVAAPPATPTSTLPAVPVSPPSTLPPTRTLQRKWGLPTLTKFDVPVLATPRVRQLTPAEENQGHAQMPPGTLATSGNSLNGVRQNRAGSA